MALRADGYGLWLVSVTMPTGYKRNMPTGVKREINMYEETNTQVAGTENVENNAVQGEATATTPKAFSQTEVDAIVEARLKRERNRTDKQFKDYEGLKQVFTTLKEVGAVDTDSPEEAAARLKQFYAKGDGESVGEPSAKEPKKTSAVLPEDQRIALIEYSVEKYVKNASEEDLEDDFETLKSKGKRRSDEDDIKFAAVSKKLAEINAKKSAEQQIEDFKSKFPKVSIDDLKADADFTEFLKLSKVPLADSYSTYQKLKGVTPTARVSLGSVASSSETPETALYSSDELKQLKPDDLNKNFDLIRKSAIANIKKSIKT